MLRLYELVVAPRGIAKLETLSCVITCQGTSLLVPSHMPNDPGFSP